MKRSIKIMFATSVVTLMLASCSDEETVDVNNGRAIDFRTSVGSRTPTTTISNLDEICVSAFQLNADKSIKSLYFGGGAIGNTLYEIFTKQDGYFKSTTNFYWPADNSDLLFYAYAPTYAVAPAADGTGGVPFLTNVTIDQSRQVIENFLPDPNIANQIDLVTATATANKKTGEASGVTLTFEHRLSQIEIRAFSNNTKYNFYVSGVRIGRVCATGTFRFSNNEWVLGSYDYGKGEWNVLDTDKFSYSAEYSPERQLEPLPAAEEGSLQLGTNMMPVEGTGYANAYLLPQKLVPWDRDADYADGTKHGTGAYIALKLRITEKATGKEVYPEPWGPEYAWAAVPVSGTWVKGKKYIYNLNLNTGAGFVDPEEPQPGTPILSDPIKFDVFVTGFDDPEAPENLDFPEE